MEENIYPTKDLQDLQMRERDLFNQRKGEIRGNIECIHRDLILYEKKVKKYRRQSRIINWFNIVSGNATFLAATGVGIATSIVSLNPLVIGIVIGAMSGIEVIKSLSLFTTVKVYCKKKEQKYTQLRDLARQFKERLFIYSHKVFDDNRITIEEVQTAAMMYGEYRTTRDKLLDSTIALDSQVNPVNPVEEIIKASKLSHSAKEKIRKELYEKDLREKVGLVDKPKEHFATVNLQSPPVPSAPSYSP
jgi:hypothetical protein